jgi:hypothetical protein
MTAFEVINLIRLEVNKLASNLYQDWEDPEIEDIFNQIMYSHIVSKYTPKGNSAQEGFEMSQLRKSDLAPLVIEDYMDYVFTTSDSNKQRFVLPSDFMFYENSASQVYYNDCAAIVTANNNINTYYFVIPFSPGTEEDFSGFRIQTQSSSNIITNANGGNYINPKDKDAFVQYILSLTPSSDYTIYWEKAKNEATEGTTSVLDTFHKDSFIVVRNNSSAPNIKYSWDGSTYTNLSVSQKTSVRKSGTSGGYRTNFSNIERQQGFIKQDLQSNFRSPIPQEPLITRERQYLSIYTNSDFIVEKLYLTYTKKPRKISVSLQQDCELPEHVIRQIIAQCATHIKGETNPQGYQIAQNEENKIVK